MTAHPVPGWYGKLPSQGDFASRRLPAAFIEAWDGWLAGHLAAWREADPAGWLPQYLAAPVWRFVLAPGVLPAAAGGPAFVGVMMPSVDRVGRYFPLTLVADLAELPAGPGEPLQAWLANAERLAQAALQDDWTIEQLDAALAGLGPANATLPDAGLTDAGIAATDPALPRPGQSAWWCAGMPPGAAACITHGLPDRDEFLGLMTLPAG